MDLTIESTNSPSQEKEKTFSSDAFRCSNIATDSNESIPINMLCDVLLAKIFGLIPWTERLRLECICKRWHRVSKYNGWSNFTQFDNSAHAGSNTDAMYAYAEKHGLKDGIRLSTLWERCGRYIRHLSIYKWSADLIFSYIQEMPNLIHLELYYVDLKVKHLELLPAIPNLKSLHLSSSMKFVYNSPVFSDYLRNAIHLEYLMISEGSSGSSTFCLPNIPPNLVSLAVKTQIQDLQSSKKVTALTLRHWIPDPMPIKNVLSRLTFLQAWFGTDKRCLEFFDLMPNIRALNFIVDTHSSKIFRSIANNCKFLEHLSYGCYRFTAEITNDVQHFSSLKKLSSFESTIHKYGIKKGFPEYFRQLDSLKTIRQMYINHHWTLKLDTLCEILKNCSFIEYIDLTEHYDDIDPYHKEHYSKLFETVDEIDATTTEKHHEVTLNLAHFTGLKPFRYKWLHFEMNETSIPALEKWQYGGLSAGKPTFAFSN